MTVKEKLVATLPPLGFIVDGHTEEFDFCCEDVNGYDCLLTLELHPNFLYAVAFVFPSPQSPDSVEFDIEFPPQSLRLVSTAKRAAQLRHSATIGKARCARRGSHCTTGGGQ